MIRIPESLRVLIDELSDLPSIGPRQATRLSFHLIDRGKDSITRLKEALGYLENLKTCERCFFIHENEGRFCDICSDPTRDPSAIMLVEKETDLVSLEQTKKFFGNYFILGQIPKTGILDENQKVRLDILKNYIKQNLGGQASEIILAFNPTSIGNWNASMFKKELENLAKKITRLGRGLPTGGEIEFADDETLEGSLLSRS